MEIMCLLPDHSKAFTKTNSNPLYKEKGPSERKSTDLFQKVR